jgi:flagellar hook-basal body complex protein FliE
MVLPVTNMPAVRSTPVSAKDVAAGFGNVLDRSMQSIQNQEQRIESLTKELASGSLDNVHHIVIASEQLGLTVQLATQVRNKAIEAYQEVMRMQL